MAHRAILHGAAGPMHVSAGPCSPAAGLPRWIMRSPRLALLVVCLLGCDPVPSPVDAPLSDGGTDAPSLDAGRDASSDAPHDVLPGPSDAFDAPSDACALSLEICGNGLDDDCDGNTDEDVDVDGDGFPSCQDCADDPALVADAARINPGAIELALNGLDDDCDPVTLDDAPPASCSDAAILGGTALDLAHAMELCSSTTETGTAPGLIAASLTLADGSPLSDALRTLQVSVRESYGPNVVAPRGATFGAISTGTARVPGEPGYVPPQNGPMPGDVGNFVARTSVPLPSDLLAAFGGRPPSAPGCPCTLPICGTANDSVLLHLRLRVPSNAAAFSYRVRYFTAEYPEYRCTPPTDTFLALSSSLSAPPGRSVAFSSDGTPLSVDSPFLDVCFPRVTDPPGSCSAGTLDLVGNGMGGFRSSISDGGGTEWLENRVPVTPGEVMALDLVIWDGGDGNVDSIALLDDFRWHAAAPPGPTLGP